MRRFNFDDEETGPDNEEVDRFFEDPEFDLTPEEYEALVNQQQLQAELIQQELNQRLLLRAIKMLEKSFFWKFYSFSTRLKMIEKTYQSFFKIQKKV